MDHEDDYECNADVRQQGHCGQRKDVPNTGDQQDGATPQIVHQSSEGRPQQEPEDGGQRVQETDSGFARTKTGKEAREVHHQTPCEFLNQPRKPNEDEQTCDEAGLLRHDRTTLPGCRTVPASQSPQPQSIGTWGG